MRVVINEDTVTLLVGMSAATIDQRLARNAADTSLKGRSHTKTGIASGRPRGVVGGP